LDTTAFYPNSGGQPHDTGSLARDGEEFPVLYVGLTDGKICNQLGRAGLVEGDRVAGFIDWERRYMFMRSHTACHLLSAFIYRETGAMITGNQIGEDRSRVDLQACGGTHVGRTGKIGFVKMLKAENKGRANRRVYFRVLDGD